MSVWVPENCIFKSDGECLDAMPDHGAAVLLYDHQDMIGMRDKIIRYLVPHRYDPIGAQVLAIIFGCTIGQSSTLAEAYINDQGL